MSSLWKYLSQRNVQRWDFETFGNAVDLEKTISVKLNSRQNISHIIGSEDLSKILNDFDKRISENSVKTIANCKQHSIQKSRTSLCSANSSYSSEDINNFVNKFSELNNHTYSSTAEIHGNVVIPYIAMMENHSKSLLV